MLSISSGLMLDNPSPPSANTPPPFTEIVLSLKLVLSIGTPLITISGLFCPDSDDWPRMRIFEVPPGPVPSEEIFTPATLPCKGVHHIAGAVHTQFFGFHAGSRITQATRLPFNTQRRDHHFPQVLGRAMSAIH